MVDVLSGTSAGGLNSLFLAKALANDQDMEGLKTLWMEEGELTRLLNDADSVKDECGLANPSEPTSLLNSQRMYKKLLEALDAMDFPGERCHRKPSRLQMKISPRAASLRRTLTILIVTLRRRTSAGCRFT